MWNVGKVTFVFEKLQFIHEFQIILNILLKIRMQS